jgi:hypothetical protein
MLYMIPAHASGDFMAQDAFRLHVELTQFLISKATASKGQISREELDAAARRWVGEHAPEAAPEDVNFSIGQFLDSKTRPIFGEVKSAKLKALLPARTKTQAVNPSSPTAAIISAMIRGEYLYSIIGLVMGTIALVFGCFLVFWGIAGHSSLTASVLGLSASLNDAAPGVVLFLVGFFVVWATRPTVKLGNLRDE